MSYIDDIKNKSSEDLRTELANLSKELFNLRLKKSTGQAIKSHNFKLIRRNIARILTVLSSK